MTYEDIKKGLFIKRPNRFISHVLIDGVDTIAHVKNTGRCREILKPGTTVMLEHSEKPERKTSYSLISAYKDGILINIDSQVPNRVVYEALKRSRVEELEQITTLKREVAFGKSRFDLYYESIDSKGFIEVKGVTLETNGVAMFPDAPTVRGVKHVYEMIDVVKAGMKGYIFFLIQFKGVKHFTPNLIMDPEFSKSLADASNNGVKILAYDSEVTENSIELGGKIPVIL